MLITILGLVILVGGLLIIHLADLINESRKEGPLGWTPSEMSIANFGTLVVVIGFVIAAIPLFIYLFF